MSVKRTPKLCGSDVEVGNFVLSQGGEVASALTTGPQASRALLAEVDGAGDEQQGYWSGHVYYNYYNAQDWGRKYLHSNGGCIYIDLNHLELCTPEVVSAWDQVAAHYALLRIARSAQEQANAELGEGQEIQVLINNSDGRSNSYGSHLNFLVDRDTWNNVFHHKLHQMLFLASHQVSSIVLTGQGKVGSECGQPPAPYQLAQRADFMETLIGVQTTHNRPLVNSRDEALCGNGGEEYGRIHCIFYDNNLCQVAQLLKVGAMQIVLAMIEAGDTNLDLLLDDPVRSVVRWSHGADLATRCALTSGEQVTAVELQLRFVSEARRALELGVLDAVPRADELLDLWEDTLQKLQAGDLSAVLGRLDWALKQHILETARADRNLDWDAPELKYLDLVYSSLDPAKGLFWAYDRAGVVEHVVSEDEIDRFVGEPPEDTRAWTRAMLLRRLQAASDTGQVVLDDVDWDEIKVRVDLGRGFREWVRIPLTEPLGATRADTEALFAHFSRDDDLPLLLAALEAHLVTATQNVSKVASDASSRQGLTH